MALLSQLVDTLMAAVAQQQQAVIASVKGVGPKMAEKLLIELRNRFPDGRAHVAKGSLLAAQTAAAPVSGADRGSVVLALQQLGYRAPEVQAMLDRLDWQQEATLSERIKQALAMQVQAASS